jgi:hypothetical protein
MVWKEWKVRQER